MNSVLMEAREQLLALSTNAAIGSLSVNNPRYAEVYGRPTFFFAI